MTDCLAMATRAGEPSRLAAPETSRCRHWMYLSDKSGAGDVEQVALKRNAFAMCRTLVDDLRTWAQTTTRHFKVPVFFHEATVAERQAAS